ncbi:hypothetical protein NGM37_43730, partial [Streptomyces sp. TRM76130]|nr:hypothetical protein [Streptomyces sp. TRM76130]
MASSEAGAAGDVRSTDGAGGAGAGSAARETARWTGRPDPASRPPEGAGPAGEVRGVAAPGEADAPPPLDS